jgi:hypothetical protein
MIFSYICHFDGVFSQKIAGHKGDKPVYTHQSLEKDRRDPKKEYGIAQ